MLRKTSILTKTSIFIVFLFMMTSCKGGNSPVQPVPGDNPDYLKVGQAQFKGRVELPNPDMDPSDYKVQVAKGIFEIKPDGTFEVPMNMGTTGLITILDTNDNPVLYKVFPKHELLIEQEPVVNAESTAVASMFLNPLLARFNNPLKASVILENLRRTDAVHDLTTLIIDSFNSRKACFNNEQFWNLAGKGFDELMSKSGNVQSSTEPGFRKGQSDQDDPWFFDRDGINADAIDISGFTITNGETAKFNYSNAGYKWWMVTIDHTSPEPEYTPDCEQDYINPENIIALIPPASFAIPSLSEIVDDIEGQTILGIAAWISNNYWEFVSELAQADYSELGPAEGEVNFELPSWGINHQIGVYSTAFKSDLDITDPDSPDRTAIPSLFQIFYQFAVPVLSIYFDDAEYTIDPDEALGYLFYPQFEEVLTMLNPSFQKLQAHMYSYQSKKALGDCYEIIGKILADKEAGWFVREVIFDGNIPETSLNTIVTTVLSSQKIMDTSECFGMFMASMIHTVEIPNFDNYVIDVLKYPNPNLPYDLKVVSINRGELGADPERITSIDLDWDDVENAYQYSIQRTDGDAESPWSTVDTCTDSQYKYVISGENDLDMDFRFRISASITGTPDPEISQEVYVLFVSNAGYSSSKYKWSRYYELDRFFFTIWSGASNVDDWPSTIGNAVGFLAIEPEDKINCWTIVRSRQIPDLVGQSEAFSDGYWYLSDWKDLCGIVMGTVADPNPSGTVCCDFIPSNDVYNSLFAYNYPDLEGLNQEFCTQNQAGWSDFDNSWMHVGYYLNDLLASGRDYIAFGAANGNSPMSESIFGWSDAWAFVVH